MIEVIFRYLPAGTKKNHENPARIADDKTEIPKMYLANTHP
jgi:hypothetical protein